MANSTLTLLSLVSRQPLTMLAGMAQLTVKVGFVSAVIDTGYDIELAGGGHYKAAALRSEILKLIAAAIGITRFPLYQPWSDTSSARLLERSGWTARTGSRIGPHTAMSRCLREEPAEGFCQVWLRRLSARQFAGPSCYDISSFNDIAPRLA